MGLAQAGTAVDEQRVEGAAARVGRDAQAGGAAQAVAAAFNEVLEIIDRIEAGLDIELAQARNRIDAAGVVLARIGDGHIRIADTAALGTLLDENVVENAHLIKKGGRRADLPAEHLAQQADEMLFDVLPPEIRGDLDRQTLVFERDRLDGTEPGLERFFVQVVPEDLKAAVPYGNLVVGSHKVVGSGLVPTTKLGKNLWKKKLFFNCFF